MKYDPDINHRQSVRLQGYDYSNSGMYFVTVCVQGKEPVLGMIENWVMRLNETGKMVEKWWLELERKFDHVRLDEYVTMPDHFHGIVEIIDPMNPVGAVLRVRPEPVSEPISAFKSDSISKIGVESRTQGGHAGPPLLEIMRWFKTMTTNEYIRHVKNDGWNPFAGKLWQRNYYEHIIRDDDSLNEIREYIRNNPIRWAERQ
jgi:putative transposase